MTDDRITPAEFRQFMAETRASFEALQEEIETMRAGLQTASQPAASQTTSFIADEISVDFMEGKPVYKLRGNEYRKFGVRIWPEVMQTLGIDADLLKPGKNALTMPINVMVKMVTKKDETTGEVRTSPHKVIGRV